MKIKTITCHNVYNHGASLQEHALLAFLSSLGHDAEAINYQPPHSSKLFDFKVVSNPKFDLPIIKWFYILAKLPIRAFYLRKKFAFDDFSRKYIPSGKQVYTSSKELKINLPEADVFICGSDQIWNTLFENGKDPAFYLDFVPNHKLKFSYAASFATNSLDVKYQSFVRDKIKQLDAVSVRESSGLKILEKIGIKHAQVVLDPVFLMPYHYWVLNFVKPMGDDFIFIYDFDSNPLIKKLALDLKSKTNCLIYTINSNIKYADRNFSLEGPDIYLSLMFNAKLVLTNSFHAIAFSLIFQKQFYLFNRTEQINSRMLDLLKVFKLENRLVTDLNNIDHSNIVYEKINQEFELAIQESKNFLMNTLSRHK